MPLRSNDSGRLAIAFVGARGIAIVLADARGLHFGHRRGRPCYHILGRARLVITSADTGSLAITSAFVSGFRAVSSHPQASSSHRRRCRPSLSSPSVSNVSPSSSHSSKSKSLHRIVAIAENERASRRRRRFVTSSPPQTSHFECRRSAITKTNIAPSTHGRRRAISNSRRCAILSLAVVVPSSSAVVVPPPSSRNHHRAVVGSLELPSS